ncbi:TetR/AcrR family transcriptional regulator [Nocardia fluminea]|uniref:TetR/AcrR family transcriptional regulator n=1 Tax=Nocardia fluminea TaxID=134984 RepID=UPI0033CB2896
MAASKEPTRHSEESAAPSWTDRAAQRSRSVQRSRARSIEQAQLIVEAARRLLEAEGSEFTTQQLIKEAGIALQTFYRHFPSKDQLLLAVFEDIIAERAAEIANLSRGLPDPVARLRFYVLGALRSVRGDDVGTGPRFITAEHWRLYQLFPAEMARANQPFADLIADELRHAEQDGLLRPRDPATDAWLAMKLVMSVFHHYAFAPEPADVDDIATHLWSFCLAAFGGPSPER